MIVAQVKAAMQTDVCTIYLHDKASKVDIRATEGLNQLKSASSGWGLTRGSLVGGNSRGTANLDDASAHPQFQWVEGIRRNSFNAFLGHRLFTSAISWVC